MTAAFTPLSVEVQRDRWGRPLIEPPDGGRAEAYTRVSTLAKTLDDKTALTRWKQRMTAMGMGMRPDLAQLAAVSADDSRKLDEIVEQAMAAAESNRAANVGTVLHKLAEHVDAGTLPEKLPAETIADLTAYEKAMREIEILASEGFVVVDELKAAGSFDRLVRVPDGRIMVADLKTGQHEPRYPHASAIQISIYAHGHLYDPERGRLGHLPSLGVDQERGLLIHLPAGSGTCQLYLVDLTVGWAMAQAAVVVRDVFRSKPIAPFTTH